MSEVQTTLIALQGLCTSISHFIDHETEASIFHAPIIDHFHPSDYSQRGIQGLRKFLTHAKSELDYVSTLAKSTVAPKEFTTNAPHILAVWHEFLRAPRPLGVISQILDCENEGSVKVDVVAEGGNLWVKVNTEQDSYDNSDYDSESSSSRDVRQINPQQLTNSLIAQAQGLVLASKAFVRPKGQPIPRIKLVLPRINEPTDQSDDERVPRTFDTIRKMGIELQFGPTSGPPHTRRGEVQFQPTSNIVLDLSVLVALCCDSTHHPLPTSGEELEGRFRPLTLYPSGELELAAHSNVSADLCDQLRWEMTHPLVEELQDQLAPLAVQATEPRWWITQEVKDRLPKLVDVIGGPAERRRGKALLGEGQDFWAGSRWQGKEGILEDLKLEVLPTIEGDAEDLTDFDRGIIGACRTFLELSVPRTDLPTPPLTPTPPDGMSGGKKPKYPPKQKRNKRNLNASFQISRLPTGHTLRTMLAGASRGWTVLTNNRGAVGKICREMGVQDGISEAQSTPTDGLGERTRSAAVWVVNPSSLAEWRRLEVEEANRQLRHRPLVNIQPCPDGEQV